jgi:hypothetical protein
MKVADFKSYHWVWLGAHPFREAEWLGRMLDQGFHIHHMDGDHSNDHPDNLVLIEASDHMFLHGMGRESYLKRVKAKKPAEAIPEPKVEKPQEVRIRSYQEIVEDPKNVFRFIELQRASRMAGERVGPRVIRKRLRRSVPDA